MEKTTNNKKKILIVEDDVVVRRLLEKALTKEGFDILTAEDGERGLKTALDNKPNLILLDILMPKMDGLEVLKALRESQECRNTQVILMTNLVQNEKIEEAMRYRVSDYLIKSNWNINEVVVKIKERLGVE